VPWNRQILHGIEVLRNPKFNKGMSFTTAERRELRIEGLLPPVVITQEIQVKRVMASLRKQATDLDRYIYIMVISHHVISHYLCCMPCMHMTDSLCIKCPHHRIITCCLYPHSGFSLSKIRSHLQDTYWYVYHSS
jgi:hypothetical protein